MGSVRYVQRSDDDPQLDRRGGAAALGTEGHQEQIEKIAAENRPE